MRLGYAVRPQADRDIDEIADYLVEQSGLDTGLRFLNELYDTFTLLASHQELGWRSKLRHPQLGAVRSFPVSKRFDKYLSLLPSAAGFNRDPPRSTWRTGFG